MMYVECKIVVKCKIKLAHLCSKELKKINSFSSVIHIDGRIIKCRARVSLTISEEKYHAILKELPCRNRRSYP